MSGPAFPEPAEADGSAVPAEAAVPAEPRFGACSADADCVTCGDVAVPLTVVSVPAGGADALCRDDEGRRERVATDFVGPVGVGDRLLVHAGVALEVLASAASEPDDARPPEQPAWQPPTRNQTPKQPQPGGRDAVRG